MKYYEVKSFNKTKKAFAFYTSAEREIWKYGKEEALANCRKLASTFGLSAENMVMVNQTHTADVIRVTESNGGEMVTRRRNYSLSDPSFQSPYSLDEEGCDGMVTDRKGIMLCTLQADCVPLYFLDPEKEVVGMVHSGWRGTVGKISKNAVDLMVSAYGCDPKSIMACIGPCICENCYEVGADLIEPFTWAFGQKGREFFGPAPEAGKFLLNMRGAIRETLLEAGLDSRNIHDVGRCTYEDEDLCSWRRQRPVRTSMVTGIFLL